MNAELDDPDVYHQDFTTASGWEEFVDRVEKIITDWKLNQPKTRPPMKKGDLEGQWETRTEKIYFEDVEFSLTLWSLKDETTSSNEDSENTSNSAATPQALIDMMSISGDFVTASNCPRIAQLYGVRDFLLLTPGTRVTISTETKAKILLSSATMAISSTGCVLPIFVQLLETWQHFYFGSCFGKDVSADFEMVHLERTPQHCKYLTGLLDTFKYKISRGQQLPSINIAARLTYTLKILRPWSIPNSDTPDEGRFLQMGTEEDPISKLYLLATWPQLTDEMVVDSQSYSDLEPMQAPFWAVKIELTKSLKPPKLSQRLASLCKLSSEALDPLISICPKNPQLSHSLDALTESKVPTISKVLDKVIASAGSSSSSKQGPLPGLRLKNIHSYLFPDVTTNSAEQYEAFENNSFEAKKRNSQIISLEGVKSAPPDSLVWRLSFIFTSILMKDGPAAAAYVWYEFSEEMRFRWENAINVPGVKPGFADHKTCILHQKLQMLNVCIERKRAREAAKHKGSSDSEEDEEDQFFDCDAAAGSAGEDAAMEDAEGETRVAHSLWNQPEGRKSKHPTLRLLNTGEPLYVPVTQDLVPKTEDAIETSEVGDLSQAHAYSCTVTLSDMESFKAANPSAVLEDFVRWHSPRDWVEEAGGALDQWGQRRGRLSARMLLPDNTWLELWSVAQPVAARRQRRLFDETRSAEGVLAWLEGLSARGLALALLPVTAHACAHRLQDGPPRLPALQAAVDKLAQHVVAASREPVQSVKTYQRLVAEVADVETLLCSYDSLRFKLWPTGADAADPEDPEDPEAAAFLSALLDQKEVAVAGGARGRIGASIKNMFAEAQKVAQMLPEVDGGGGPEWSAASPSSAFPAADTKEVVMRVVTPRPGPACRPCPQRMYALHRKDEFRLAGCFTRDLLFY